VGLADGLGERVGVAVTVGEADAAVPDLNVGDIVDVGVGVTERVGVAGMAAAVGTVVPMAK